MQHGGYGDRVHRDLHDRTSPDQLVEMNEVVTAVQAYELRKVLHEPRHGQRLGRVIVDLEVELLPRVHFMLRLWVLQGFAGKRRTKMQATSRSVVKSLQRHFVTSKPRTVVLTKSVETFWRRRFLS